MTSLPIATYLLIAVTVLISIAGFNNRHVLERFAFEVGPILRRKQLDRILTASFLHVDGGHLLVNMLTLFFFGPVLEFRYGPVGFICLYLFCSIFTGVVVLFLRRNQLQYKAVGASDAVSGVLGAYCVLYPFSKVYLFFIPIGIPAILYAVLYLAWSTWAAKRQIGNVAHDAHIAGLLAGVGVVLLSDPGVLASYLSF